MAGVGRLGVLGWTHMRDGRDHDMSTLLLASHAMGASVELERVAAEAVRAAAGTVSRPGSADGRPAALLRVREAAVTLICACDATGVEMEPGREVPLGPATPPVLQTLVSGRTAVATGDQVPAGLREVAHVSGGGAWALAMVPVAGEPFGVLAVASPDAAEFRPEDLRLLDGIARVAGLALATALGHAELDEARRVGRAKSAFLNLAAHELRTPLAVIKGYLSMLDDGTFEIPDRTRVETVGVLVRKAEELEVLVESLLTTARMEVGGLPQAITEVDVAGAVRQAVDRVAARARLEGARIEVRLPDRPLEIRADADHVGRILDNLLNNALAYSDPPADVTVTIRCGDGVEIVIADRGMGIPAEQHDRVFERFYRIDAEAPAFRPGLGLGLSISRELARANGGDLVLERSTPGAGSTFVLRLPEC
ncbi:MAG TPA: HAMP domain-containing sensor histidine kinase [Candidatus Dormibacteraeota bacterium]